MSASPTPGSAAAPERILFAPVLRLARILWRILPMVGLVAAGVFAVWILDAPRAVVEQALVGFAALLAYALAAAATREVLSPDRSWLRMVPLDKAHAARLDMSLRAVLFFATLSTYGIHLVSENGWNPALADVMRVVRNVVVVGAVTVLLVATGAVRWLRTREGERFPASLARFAGHVVFPVAVLAWIAVAVARGLGYVPLASWVLENAGASLLRVFLVVFVFKGLRRLLNRMVRFYTAQGGPSAPAGGEVVEASPYALGVVRILGGLLKIAAVILGFLWVLATWDLSADILADVFDARIVPAEAVTWGDVARGAWRVVLTLCLGWLLRSVLIYFVFPRSRASVGARYAILAVLRYVIIGLAIVFVLVAFGIDASSLGWFFGAAGIGLAFGLQDIIGNFVSGLIMLVERPIRVGDLVEVGQTMGNVEEIRMRGTVLRTFDNTTILIPNSQMLGERVTNLTHGLSHARIKVPLLVPHDADPQRVEAILLEAAATHPEVLADPEPFVWFTEFSPSSLDFMLVCFTHELRNRIGISSRLRYDIIERLRTAGIDIPVSQHEVRLQRD